MFRVTQEDDYRQRIKRCNTVCFRGMQFNASGKCTQLNTGHWSERVYPGVRKVRDGQNAFMKENTYQVSMLDETAVKTVQPSLGANNFRAEGSGIQKPTE